MEYLWAPWRMEYIKADKPSGCIFCEKLHATTDRENLILFRGETSFIIMNKYPYNNGHLMVTPYRHTGNLEDLTESELLEIMILIRKSVLALKQLFRPQGFNVGMNLGRSAGAGIADHLHYHIVPRWDGDTNFMPVISEIKVLPEYLTQTYDKLHPVLHTTNDRT